VRYTGQISDTDTLLDPYRRRIGCAKQTKHMMPNRAGSFRLFRLAGIDLYDSILRLLWVGPVL
jgi:hypothetical protein